jgi:hypothetical protein
VSDLFLFPSAVRRDPAVEAWLNARTDELGRLARLWFTRLRDCGDDVRELMHDGCPTACVGAAAFAHVGAYRAHVSVYFFFGAFLPDPARLLGGTGKRGRHVKVRPGRDLEAAALAGLIEAAYQDVKTR